jgi:hypothetical protein
MNCLTSSSTGAVDTAAALLRLRISKQLHDLLRIGTHEHRHDDQDHHAQTTTANRDPSPRRTPTSPIFNVLTPCSTLPPHLSGLLKFR